MFFYFYIIFYVNVIVYGIVWNDFVFDNLLLIFDVFFYFSENFLREI